MIGKPYSGKLNVRFDEGELEIEPLPLRQLSTLPRYTRYTTQGRRHRLFVGIISFRPEWKVSIIEGFAFQSACQPNEQH